MKFLAILFIVALQFFFVPVQSAHAYANPATVDLLTVDGFAALAKTTISSPTGPTALNNGDLGIDSPGVCTGFPSPCTSPGNGLVNSGTIQYQNAVALQGQTDATALVGNLNGRANNDTLVPQLGGLTLEQGVYEVSAAATNLTGTLTLNGDANSIFIFKMTSTLITDAGSSVVLTGGAQACNVFWTVASAATFNDTTSFVGTVLAGTSISFPGGGATLNGRAIAQTAAITFNNTTVNNSSCASTTTTSSSSSSSSSSGGSSIPVCPPLGSQVVSPSLIESRRVDADSIFISWGPYSGVNSFNIQYATQEGNWLYNTNVTGFSTTINDLPSNQPIWFRVAPRSDCTIGSYGPAMLVGGSGNIIPGLPNTGTSPDHTTSFWQWLIGIFQ